LVIVANRAYMVGTSRQKPTVCLVSGDNELNWVTIPLVARHALIQPNDAAVCNKSKTFLV